MYTQTYSFGKDITDKTLYSKETGFGFADQYNIEGSTNSERSLYSGGWNLRASARDQWDDSLCTTPYGVAIKKERFALIFRADVPEEGSYKVTVKCTAGAEGISNMAIYTSRRNLIQRDIQVAPGATYTRTFMTYVAPYIPAMSSIPSTAKSIYISATGVNATFSEITIEKVETPVLFIAGDSTLTDQNAMFPYYPFGSCAGWAQVMAQYFDTIPVCNQAHGGLTTNCFKDDGHWDIVKDRLKEGDIFIIQFGHNDQKRRNLAAFGGYINNLRWYIKEVKQRGATPIIVSPISRVPFEDYGEYRSVLEPHALACQMAAKEANVPFIDLHSLTFDFLCSVGLDKAHDYFMPGDITHTNDFGANKFASFVVNEIKARNIVPLAELLNNNVPAEFNTDSDTHTLPVEPPAPGMFDIDLPYVDIKGVPQFDGLVNAFRRGLLDPCVMHLHPTEMIPRGQFLMVYFKALRIAGKRPYLGRFCDLSRYEWDSSYAQTCVDENLIDETTVPNDHFRPDDALTQGEFASFLIRGIQPTAADRNLSMEECFAQAKAKKLLPENCAPDAIITRADCYAILAYLMELIDTSDKALPSDAEIHPVG